ncbi:MAG TPA: hypothetical protein G4O13_06450 [Dehalococcoidia bacterium]|nr:hypothetical protein [Dehalococcoidia bacterium]
MRETKLKILQYITGIALFFFVGTHLIISHLGSEEVTEWTSVADRAANSGWLVFYIILLLFGLYHGIHGLRTIILEALPRLSVKSLDFTLVIIGLAIFGYALYIPVSAF